MILLITYITTWSNGLSLGSKAIKSKGRVPFAELYKIQWQRICLPMQKTQEMRVQSLGWENPLEKEMPTHSSIIASKI